MVKVPHQTAETGMGTVAQRFKLPLEMPVSHIGVSGIESPPLLWIQLPSNAAGSQCMMTQAFGLLPSM